MTARAWAVFLALCLIWGIPYFLIKLALVELSAAMIAWARIVLAAMVMVPIAWRRGSLRPALTHKIAIIAFALVELAIPFMLITWGELWISSSLAGILIATTPLLLIIVAPLFGVHEKLGLRRLAGLVIGFVGVVAILGLDTGQGPNLWLGVAFVLVSSVCYACGALIIQRHLADVDEIAALALSLVVASVVLLPFAVLTFPAQVPSLLAGGSVVVLGWVCTAAGLLLMFHLIHAAGAARAAVVTYVNPAVAALLGVLVLREPFGAHSVLGLAMILLGSWLATARRAAPETSGDGTGPLAAPSPQVAEQREH